MLSVAATLTLPNQTVKAVLRLNGTAVAEQDVVIAAAEANHRERDGAEQPWLPPAPSSRSSSGRATEACWLAR